jgi:two-component system chemotaxis sensor kinase CheA
MDELLRDFLTETTEHIQGAETQLVMFERNPSDASLITSIFRLVHTIKGTSSFLGLNRLQRVAHAAETLLGQMRDGAPPTERSVSLVLTAIDRIRNIIEEVEQIGAEPEGDDGDVTIAVEQYAEGGHGPEAGVESHHPVEKVEAAAPAAAPVAAAAPIAASAPVTPAANHDHHDHDHDDHGDDHHGSPAAAVAAGSSPAKADAAQAKQQGNGGGARSQESIRVAVDTIERMMQLVSELVLTRNQLLELARHREDEEVKAPLQRLSALTTDLQDAVMRARMQPMARVFANLPRLVRELSTELSKKIDLVTEGADTELDRQLIEVIRDPLTHLIRNCADHGIETPEARVAAGKPEFGQIRVSASHEAGQITIDVADDGRGLNMEKIKKKAVTNGIATEADLERMTDEEIFRFIFEPGFSTAQKVTSVSGRGVGMDVVRSNIESIGGSVSLYSSPGRGSRFSMKIPLTLAIAPALIIEVANHRFALPQDAVVEAVGIGKDSRHLIETVQKALVLKLREEVLPVVDLKDVLGLAKTSEPGSGDQLVVVVRDGGRSFGVIVDGVADIQEIVVKPLSSSLSHIKVFTGHTILGDGSVALILDPAGISARLGIEKTGEKRRESGGRDLHRSETKTRVALFTAGDGAQKMLPLSLVSRIEMVETQRIERSGSDYVMMYQNRLMLMFPLSGMIDLSRDSVPVLVVNAEGTSFGLVVDEIIDIVEESLNVQIAGDDPSVIGLTEIRGKATQLIDISHFLQSAQTMVRGGQTAASKSVLVVEPRLHERETLHPVLTASSYRTFAVGTSDEAFALAEQGAKFDAVIVGSTLKVADMAQLVDRMKRKLSRPDMPVVVFGEISSREFHNEARLETAVTVPRGNRTMLLAALADAFASIAASKASSMEMAA